LDNRLRCSVDLGANFSYDTGSGAFDNDDDELEGENASVGVDVDAEEGLVGIAFRVDIVLLPFRSPFKSPPPAADGEVKDEEMWL